VEPTGLLTHHLKHDGTAEDFLRELLDRLCRHAVVRWLALGDAFALP